MNFTTLIAAGMLPLRTQQLLEKMHVKCGAAARHARCDSQQMLLGREHRKEKLPAPKMGTPSGAATASTSEPADEEQEAVPLKQVVVTYCKLDYPTLLEATQLRLHTLRSTLKKQSTDKYACSKRHQHLASSLLDPCRVATSLV